MALNILPLPVILLYLLGCVAIQSGVDHFFARQMLPGMARKRYWVLFVANTAAILVTGLVYRLTLPLTDAWLIASREQGNMAITVLLLILVYFLWMTPIIAIRGYIVQEWLLSDAIHEKKQAWWGYAAIGTLTSALLLGALYIALTIVPPLMLGMESPRG